MRRRNAARFFVYALLENMAERGGNVCSFLILTDYLTQII